MAFANQLCSVSAERCLVPWMVRPVLPGFLPMLLVQVLIFDHFLIYHNCPFSAVPNCGEYGDCNRCAMHDQCAWCASESMCTTIADAFSMDCRGLVFEPPCPDTYVSGIPPPPHTDKFCLVMISHKFLTENVVVGNLVVRADPTFGGGEFNVSGISNFPNLSTCLTHSLFYIMIFLRVPKFFLFKNIYFLQSAMSFSSLILFDISYFQILFSILNGRSIVLLVFFFDSLISSLLEILFVSCLLISSSFLL